MGRDPSITAPPDGERVLAWYESFYESVFCILHPFVRVEAEAVSFFQRDDGPTRSEVSEHAIPVLWDEIIGRTGVGGVVRLDSLLRQIDGAIEVRDAQAVALLKSLINAERLITPERGDFSPLQLDMLFNLLSRDSSDHVLAGDEFGLQRLRIEKTAFFSKAHPVVGLSHPVLFTENRSILLATHWDSYLTFFCGPADRIAEEVAALELEGFFCDADTTVPLTN